MYKCNKCGGVFEKLNNYKCALCGSVDFVELSDLALTVMENIDSNNWEVSDYEIICPYCGYAKHVEYEMYFGDNVPEVYEEGTEELTCPECGHKFLLTKEMKWEYTTEVIKEDCND